MEPRLILRFYLVLCAVFTCTSVICAASNDWAEGTKSRADGATRDYYNRAALLKWKHYMGDWHDSNNKPQGNTAYATAELKDNDTVRFVEWDVTALVEEWIKGKCQNQGMLLRSIAGSGTCHFRSREYRDHRQRPQLLISTTNGVIDLTPIADTYLEPSTYRSLGDSETLKVAMNSNNTLLRFVLSNIAKGTKLHNATLRLYTHAQYGGGTMVAGVFRCAQGHDVADSAPILGLASKYVEDKGIEENPDVIFFADFESDSWPGHWTSVSGNLQTVKTDTDRLFEPLQGNALRARIAKGLNHAMSLIYKFRKETGREPEEIFFRYYLRLGNDWNQSVQGGKLPGISGTYGVAGWGGRKSDGTNGWSARGAFHRSISEDNPLAGTHPIGTYCYHADQKGPYGEVWLWQNDYRGYLVKNRWYSIEQYLKMNTPEKKDGIIKAWVDGRLAFEKSDIRFRNVKRLKIEQIWMNVYHGGKAPSPYDQHLFIDNVVIANKYIGPMKISAKHFEKQ